MNMKENFFDEMIELLQTLCKNESLEIKFVVIYNSNNVTFIDNLLELNNYVEKIHLDYPISCLLNSFSNLKAIREDTDTKQKTIAAYLGVSQNTYSQYENGIIAMSPEMLVKAADYFNVSTDYLLGRTQNKKLYK